MRLGTARVLGASSTALDSFERIYHRWIAVQSAFVLIALALPLVRVPAVWMAIALALWGPVMLGSLFFVAGRMTPERIGSAVPHVLTGIRLVTGAGLLIVAAGLGLESARWINGGNVEPYSLLSGSEQWWLFGALVVTGLSDFVDGKVARYLGTAGFGSIWDMENDSYFALALSVAAWLVRGLPAFVLLIGAMRYLYFWIVRVHGDPPNHPPSYKLFARSVFESAHARSVSGAWSRRWRSFARTVSGIAGTSPSGIVHA